MAIHVQDEEADWMLREFARRRGVGITAAIKMAVSEASRNEEDDVEALRRRIEPVLAEARQLKRTFSTESDKDFMDEMWGEPK